MANMYSAKTPWWFWVISVVLFLWNLPSLLDFYYSVTIDEAYINQMGPDYAPAVLEFLKTLPLWVKVIWGIAVFCALSGAVLLLLRKSWAVPVFTLGLIAMVMNFFYQLFIADLPPLPQSAMIFTGLILIIAVFEVWFARRMRARGVLQ